MELGMRPIAAEGVPGEVSCPSRENPRRAQQTRTRANLAIELRDAGWAARRTLGSAVCSIRQESRIITI